MAAETFDAIAAEIKAKKFKPIYFFSGEEEYFIDELTNLIEQNALNDMEKAFNQTIIYGKDIKARQIIETCGRFPMMAERQVVIVKEAQGIILKEEDEAQYLAYFKNPVKTTLLVFAWKHGNPDGRKSFGKEAKKSAVFFESKRLYENQIAPWVKGWISKHKYKIEEAAAELLVEFTGTDISKVANELEKLIIGKPAGTTITLDDIEKGVGISKDYNVFELNNALAAGNKTKAFGIVNYFVANPKNGPMVLILGTLQGFFTKVYMVHQHKSLPDKDLAAALKTNPFFIKDYKAAAKNYSEQKLEQVFHTLSEYDQKLKGINNRSLKDGELLREMVAKILE